MVRGLASVVVLAGGLSGLTGCADLRMQRIGAEVYGTAAPDFELAALGGGRVKLSAFRGKPVVLAFFAHG